MFTRTEIKIFDRLPPEAEYIRTEVFINEQGFREEFDDKDDKSVHMVLFHDGRAAAVCRYYRQDGDYVLGRIAVLKEYRGRHFGAFLVSSAETEIKRLGGTRIVIHAQLRAEKFYIKLGYSDSGMRDLDEDCPHVWLYKELTDMPVRP